MSKAESKTKDVTVVTAKAKDVIKDPKDLKAFGGEPDDVVVSVKLPNERWAEVDRDAVNELFAKNLQKAGVDLAESADSVIAPEQILDNASLILKNSAGGGRLSKITPAALEVGDGWGNGRRISDAPQGDELPTERQIRNAEKIMKAAGLDVDSMISEAVTNALEKTQATGTFFNEGVLQDPIETGLKMEFGRITSGHLKNAFYVPHQIETMYRDKVFSLYSHQGNGAEVFYLLDGNSTVTLGGGETRLAFHRPTNALSRGALVLINSSSTDDMVLGDSLLVNTESAHNLLNNSVLARTKESPVGAYPGFSQYLLPAPASTEDIKERLNIKECQLKRSSVFDSFLTKGLYRDAQIHDSHVKGSGYVTVETSSLMETEISGTRIVIKGANLNRCNVSADGELLLKYSRFSGTRIRASSIYIPNKFNYLELDTPQHKLYFVRSTPREFDMGTQQYSMERLRLDVGEEEIRKLVAAGLSVDQEGLPARQTMLTRSVAGYLTDSIRSRLRVIRLLDDAKQLVREVGSSTRPWDDMYAL